MAPDAPPPRRPAPELRPATPADREFLYRVYSSTRVDELAAVDWPPAARDAFLRQQFDVQDRYYRQNYPEARFDVIVVDGQRVGRLYVHAPPDDCRIIDIALLPHYRGRGVGTQLVGELLAGARSRGVGVSLHVERGNRALRWYRRLGFEVDEDRGVYLLLRWKAASEVL